LLETARNIAPRGRFVDIVVIQMVSFSTLDGFVGRLIPRAPTRAAPAENVLLLFAARAPWRRRCVQREETRLSASETAAYNEK